MNKQDLLESKSFCIMPWVHLATEPNGEVKICCLSSKRLADNTHTRFNLGKNEIIEIYDSSEIKKVRGKMMSGERISECQHCWNEEDSGGVSQRQSMTKQWLKEYPELLEYIEQGVKNSYQVDSTPMYYDFRFGNLCNLKCRSCGSLNSTQINKEYKELKQQYPNTVFFFDSGEKYEALNDWYNTDQFKNNIYNNLDKIKKIYITGGEPTLIEENYKILNKLVETDQAKDVVIMFNTNMTNLRDDFYELIVKFKRVEMCISIEGYGEMQEYLRFPANWSQIDKNIKRLATLPQHISIFAVPVIQNVNLETITDFFKYIEHINNDYGFYRIRLLPIMLDSPAHLDLEILPTDYKLKCLESIETYLSNAKYFMQDEHFVGRLNHLKTKCQTEKYNARVLKQFKEFTEILDKNREQDLNKINPSLKKILDNVK